MKEKRATILLIIIDIVLIALVVGTGVANGGSCPWSAPVEFTNAYCVSMGSSEWNIPAISGLW